MTDNSFSGVRLSNNSPIPNVGSPSDFNNIYENNITANLQYGVFRQAIQATTKSTQTPSQTTPALA